MSVVFNVSVTYLIHPVISTGPEVTAVRLQSRHLHDCVPVGSEGGNGGGACRQACRANQQVSAQRACVGQGGCGLPHCAPAEPEGGRHWAQVGHPPGGVGVGLTTSGPLS